MLYKFKSSVPRTPENDQFWVAETASVIGRVKIMQDVSIWFGAVLRGDNEAINIGEGSNIQENCVLHTDIGFPLSIGKNCTIGHGAIIHGAKIADDCLIGMGAIILNGAKVNAQSLVGAGALVTEGKEFPPKSLIIGNPAKVVRELREKEIDQIKASAIGYNNRRKDFITHCEKL